MLLMLSGVEMLRWRDVSSEVGLPSSMTNGGGVALPCTFMNSRC